MTDIAKAAAATVAHMRAPIRRMREGATTEDYRRAISGEGDFGSLGYEWADKPHRLVYDLCGEVDVLRRLLRECIPALERAHAMTRGGPSKSDALDLLARVRTSST